MELHSPVQRLSTVVICEERMTILTKTVHSVYCTHLYACSVPLSKCGTMHLHNLMLQMELQYLCPLCRSCYLILSEVGTSIRQR